MKYFATVSLSVDRHFTRS